MIIAAVLSLTAIGVILWLLFALAVYALPFYAGLSAAFLAYEHDAGWLGSGVVGILVGAIVLVVGQILFATLRSPLARGIVAAAYAGPAGIAGYHAVYGVSAIGSMGDYWRIGFSIVAAIVIAGVAWARVSALYPGGPRRDATRSGDVPARFAGAANEG